MADLALKAVRTDTSDQPSGHNARFPVAKAATSLGGGDEKLKSKRKAPVARPLKFTFKRAGVGGSGRQGKQKGKEVSGKTEDRWKAVRELSTEVGLKLLLLYGSTFE